MWVYDNVRRGSTVLDVGCGSGVLALLKRKETTLVGVDLSHGAAWHRKPSDALGTTLIGSMRHQHPEARLILR